jgi:hypothetical protein
MHRFRCLLLALLVGIAPPAEAREPAGPAGVFHYRVALAGYGDIGSFSNIVRKDDAETTVETRLRIRVQVLFVTARSIDADREERWDDGRLIAYRSRTTRNGSVITVSGHAVDGHFIIEGPHGRSVAPSDVFPSNPWSIDITEARVVMATETGRLTRIHFHAEPDQTIEIRGRSVIARRFVASTDDKPELWYGSDNTLLKFAIVDHGERLTFTLE